MMRIYIIFELIRRPAGWAWTLYYLNILFHSKIALKHEKGYWANKIQFPLTLIIYKDVESYTDDDYDVEEIEVNNKVWF